MMVLVVMVVLLGARSKKERVWVEGRRGEKRRGAQRLQEWWGERWTVG